MFPGSETQTPGEPDTRLNTPAVTWPAVALVHNHSSHINPFAACQDFPLVRVAADFALSATGDVLDLFTACSFTSALL